MAQSPNNSLRLSQSLRTNLKSSLLLRSIKYLVDDYWQGIKNSLSITRTLSGTRHLNYQTQESISYIENVFNDYKVYGSISHFRGRVAEIGPGDNAGVAMLIRKDGADKVDLIDRFHSVRDRKHQEGIYRALSERHQLNDLRKTKDWDEDHLEGIKWFKGVSAEEHFAESGLRYDYIISRAVFEHLYDPLTTLGNMIKSLEPQGKIIHKIDLRDHGLFSSYGHELSFLSIPEFFYRRMVRNSGRPNRILAPDYVRFLEAMADRIEYKVYATRLVGVGEINPHLEIRDLEALQKSKARQTVEARRARMSHRFREMPADLLAVSGIFLEITKKQI